MSDTTPALTIGPGIFYIGTFHQEVARDGKAEGNVVTTLYREVGVTREYHVHIRWGFYRKGAPPGQPLVGKHFEDNVIRREDGDTDESTFVRWQGYLTVDGPRRIYEKSEGKVVMTLAQAQRIMGDYEAFIAWMLTQDHIQMEFRPNDLEGEDEDGETSQPGVEPR